MTGSLLINSSAAKSKSPKVATWMRSIGDLQSPQNGRRSNRLVARTSPVQMAKNARRRGKCGHSMELTMSGRLVMDAAIRARKQRLIFKMSRGYTGNNSVISTLSMKSMLVTQLLMKTTTSCTGWRWAVVQLQSFQPESFLP